MFKRDKGVAEGCVDASLQRPGGLDAARLDSLDEALVDPRRDRVHPLRRRRRVRACMHALLSPCGARAATPCCANGSVDDRARRGPRGRELTAHLPL